MKCISKDFGLIIAQTKHWLTWFMTYYWSPIRVVSPCWGLTMHSIAFVITDYYM